MGGVKRKNLEFRIMKCVFYFLFFTQRLALSTKR